MALEVASTGQSSLLLSRLVDLVLFTRQGLERGGPIELLRNQKIKREDNCTGPNILPRYKLLSLQT